MQDKCSRVLTLGHYVTQSEMGELVDTIKAHGEPKGEMKDAEAAASHTCLYLFWVNTVPGPNYISPGGIWNSAETLLLKRSQSD